MRTGAATIVLSAAAVLGTVTGAVVLPDPEGPSTGRAGSPSPAAAREAATAATPDPPRRLGRGPVAAENMLTAADFAVVGLTVTARRADFRLELPTCDGRVTMADVAKSGPPVQRHWTRGSVVASEEAVALRYPYEAAAATRRLLRRFEVCQEQPPHHWVFGRTHTERLDPATTASWLASVDSTLNTTGRAPTGAPIVGGVAVLRRGLHVAVLYLSMCASPGESVSCDPPDPDRYPDQLAALSRAAALRLG